VRASPRPGCAGQPTLTLTLVRLRFAQRAKAVKLTVKRNTFAIKVRPRLGTVLLDG
jgi:hypothetical protein